MAKPELFTHVCVLFACFVGLALSQQIITPPPPQRWPVEANGKLYNLFYVPNKCKDPWVMSNEEFGGGLVLRNKHVIMEKYGPYNVQGNIEIAPEGCLVIMPGVEMYFNPGHGIIVNGTLIARVSYFMIFPVLFLAHLRAEGSQDELL